MEKELLENAGSLFEGKRGPKPINTESGTERLYAKIRQLNRELDRLKEVWDQPVDECQSWKAPNEPIALSRQCKRAQT